MILHHTILYCYKLIMLYLFVYIILCYTILFSTILYYTIPSSSFVGSTLQNNRTGAVRRDSSWYSGVAKIWPAHCRGRNNYHYRAAVEELHLNYHDGDYIVKNMVSKF